MPNGFGFFAAILSIVLTLFLLALAYAAHAAEQITDPQEKRVVADCYADGWRYCKHAIPQGRAAVINCMQENKDKLRPKCSRHLY